MSLHSKNIEKKKGEFYNENGMSILYQKENYMQNKEGGKCFK